MRSVAASTKEWPAWSCGVLEFRCQRFSGRLLADRQLAGECVLPVHGVGMALEANDGRLVQKQRYIVR